ncbi:MAG TPA: methyltransferase domain-containing protein [Candidatus Aphodovivens excrementavium]|nr:methyltransferase domain-containing protein [Candidatus Aphodovivens excrementavium]
MNIQSAKQQIKDAVEAYLRKDDAGMPVIDPVHQRPVFLLGAPGIGKTAIMEQIAGELGIGIVSYSMTHHTRQSALGLPRIEHHEFEGYEYEASEYTMSEIVAAVYDYMARTGLRQGILFLDEINCVSETLYPSMLQFLQFKKFGKHKVPDGWVVVCAGNPPEYNRSVHEFDIVTLDRMREIDVEPEYAAWKNYAQEKGLHPAVTTFLDAKKDCFYKVESKPGGGKSFVTARGWEDLAQIISLYEDMGKPVDRELFCQFLRDEGIADAFTVYYALFQKYRSDYQVDSILAGDASEAIAARAKEAEFDERVALISLLLDALARECSEVLGQEGVVLELRDLLRDAKGEFLNGGATVDEALVSRVERREATLGRRVAAGTASHALVHREKLVIALLRDFVARCIIAKTTEGEPAFRTIEAAYKEEVAKIKPAAQRVSMQIDAAFDFIDECFGSREMLVFMAELATRKATTQFVAHYGNDKYYQHNEELQVDAARMGLQERASMLADLNEKIEGEGAAGIDMGDAVGLSLGGEMPEPRVGDGAAASVSHGDAEVDNPAQAAEDDGGQISSPRSGEQIAPDGRALRRDASALAEFYSGKQFEYGFTSVCKMLLPASELKGKKVLNICCRRGRGVYKMSAMAGNEGTAMGVDWSPAYVEEAKDGMNRAWHDSGLKRNNMEFRVAYPEDLISAGIGSSTMDVVYCNNVATLFYDQATAIREFGRVLKPGGLLIFETIFADRPRREEIVEKARAMGNSVQAARTQEENYAWLEAAGFASPSIEEEYEVEADRGYKAGSKVAIVEGDDDVRYKAVSLYVRKK